MREQGVFWANGKQFVNRLDITRRLWPHIANSIAGNGRGECTGSTMHSAGGKAVMIHHPIFLMSTKLKEFMSCL